jgi:hypothetical protein
MRIRTCLERKDKRINLVTAHALMRTFSCSSNRGITKLGGTVDATKDGVVEFHNELLRGIIVGALETVSAQDMRVSWLVSTVSP